MKIIIDECISNSTRVLLKNLGFELLSIENILKFGEEDENIYQFATTNNIPIITHDRRFGRIYFESNSNPATVIVLKSIVPHPKETNNLLKSALTQIDITNSQYRNKLIIIDSHKIRIRSKPDLNI
jgi:predicted nuclease of predicted toxin-antitoxin system